MKSGEAALQAHSQPRQKHNSSTQLGLLYPLSEETVALRAQVELVLHHLEVFISAVVEGRVVEKSLHQKDEDETL